jgi:hypothetical protein
MAGESKTQTSGGEKPTSNCKPLDDAPTPPEFKEPDKCPSRCDCPSEPPSDETCFDTLIKEQNRLVNQADQAKESKAELEEMLKNANTAKQSYTRKIFEDLTDRWLKLDDDFVTAIQTVTCNVKCWWCVIECHICPLLYKIREIETLLEGSGPLITNAYSLPDLQHWHKRNVAARRRVFDRTNEVLKAWNDPAKSIDAALKANEDMLKNLRQKEPVEGLVQVLLEGITRHLAIAPRPITTKIDKKYIDICVDCDKPAPDDCCGPDVGLPTARQRLITPQAYIVDPNDYLSILCCILTERYRPAKEQLDKAQADLDDVTKRIDDLTASLVKRIENPLADYRRDIAAEIDCDNYKKKNGNGCGDDGEQTTEQTAS